MPLPTRIHFAVTQRHIDAATPRDAEHCPIALAMREEIEELGENTLRVFVGQDSISLVPISIQHIGLSTTYGTPANAKQFITAFDAGFPVEPFEISAWRR